MTEEDARDWLASRYSAPKIARLERFVALLETASTEQSLIARSTLPAIWSRHIVDSAQLVPLGSADGAWLDIGSGGGLPGIVVAILRDAPMVLSEPRRKRIDFLTSAIASLDLKNTIIEGMKVQNLPAEYYQIVSARAVAPIGDVFMWCYDIVSRETRFLLPRGQTWASELEIAKRAWHGRFHVEQSLTDPTSGIVVATQVTKR